jgi:hypothetical protein
MGFKYLNEVLVFPFAPTHEFELYMDKEIIFFLNKKIIIKNVKIPKLFCFNNIIFSNKKNREKHLD